MGKWRTAPGLAGERDAQLTSRRGFLRRAGITGALAAGFIGTAEVAGLSTALAARSGPGTRRIPFPCQSICKFVYSPGRCAPGGGKCPSGSCCFYQSGSCCAANRYNCIAGHCSTFTQCCGG
jgi:hypothetical protein